MLEQESVTDREVSSSFIERLFLIFVKVFIFTFLLIFFVYVPINFWLGDDLFWANQGAKGGDLLQHYASGVMWEDGKSHDLYRDFKLGDWINQWQRDLWGEQTFGQEERLKNFNYVYCPLTAAMASWLLVFDFGTWMSWAFNLGLIYYIMACLFMIKSLKHLPKTPEPLLMVLLLLSFPSIYYALIPLQNTQLTLLLLVLAGISLNRNSPFIAGIIFSCAFYKPQLMPYFCAFSAIALPWRFAAGLISGNVLWLLLGIIICGWESHQLWWASLKDMTSGVQFQRDGLNQSWRGFILSHFSETNRFILDIISHTISLVLLTLVALVIRLKKSKIAWRPAYTLYICASIWLLASPYVGHYGILLGLPWWFVVLRQNELDANNKYNKWVRYGLAGLFWLISLLSITGQVSGTNLTAPFLTCWVLLSLKFYYNLPETIAEGQRILGIYIKDPLKLIKDYFTDKI
ncbi:MAG: glycosyltransferase 87 family protein [Verrucomicrobiota bacterium]